jgi:UDP-N-acetylmuramoyl-L-alanyl-D-glutamate--2,6-diaminopimelate ligase
MRGVTEVGHIMALLESAGAALVPASTDAAAVVVTSVTHDSRQVEVGTLFACLVGDRSDGHEFAVAAVQAGAAALLVERELTYAQLAGVPQIVVDSTRLRLGPISALVAGEPADALTMVGVTGTNGKTTICSMLATIFEANQWATGIIGTLHGPRTTPEAPELQARLARFVAEGQRAAVLEVSSHALALHRVDGTHFDAVVFTNLGHDHLDLHGTPEEYFRAKASLFVSTFAPLALINEDDTHGRLLIDVVTSSDDDITVIPFSTSVLTDVRVTATSIDYRWRGHNVSVSIGGDFNVSNSLAALETAVALGVDPALAALALSSLPTVPGRFESVSSSNGSPAPFSVVVDYAHTPDGVTEVLAAARSVVAEGAAVIVVFGCGGDRDHAKRPAMGAAAAAGADRVIITSDNPRTEDPVSIINDINEGVAGHYRDRVTSQPDRRLAIGAAFDVARPGDIVVIAGKGHEQTQDLGGNVVAFDDRAVARSFLDTTTSESMDLS